MLRQFEIPYNFDKSLITFLHIYNPTGELYHCIYLPPFRQDYISAKYYTNYTNKDIASVWNIDREEYIDHVQNIQKYFPNKVMLLLQQTNIVLSAKELQWYINLGITKFCVGSLEQAKIIKNISNDFEIVGSITMKIELNDLKNPEYEKYFDSFVLWFPYNRDLNTIQKLPKCFNYILLVNCSCNIECDGTHHWFASPEVEQSIPYTCPNVFTPGSEFRKRILIRPMDLSVFDSYIKYYKLQGREYKTPDIIRDIVLYSSSYQKYEGLHPRADMYYRDNINNRKQD